VVSELLQRVRILDPVTQADWVGDVLIVDGLIQAVAEQVTEWPAETQIRDCQGLILGPGLVDLYSQSGEPGFESRETLASLAQAAIAGGFTRLTLLPNMEPALDNLGGLEWLRQRTDQYPLKFQFWGALTHQLAGEQMTELAELAAAGVVGFTDSLPLKNLALVRRSLEYLQPLQRPIALWPCSTSLAGDGVIRDGAAAIRYGLTGNPAIAETTALATLLELVAAIGTPVHIMRVSTARSVELLQAARDRGLPVTASTTWMHLLLNTEAIASYDPNLRVEPPLGNPEDQQALIQGVKSGVISAIAIDHTPYTYEEKTVPFAEAPPGVIGLELALPLLWQAFVATGVWTALELWQALSQRSAECLGQGMGAIAPQQPAELTLFDPQQQWTVTPETLHSLSSNTPWLGQPLTGRVLRTWCH
jgi:dihydroorotase